MKLKWEKKAEEKERAEYIRKYGGLEGWERLRPKVEARYNTKEEEDADEEVKEQRLMRQDQFRIKKLREREARK